MTVNYDHGNPANRRFVSYIDKSRDYYRAKGFAKPYRWAVNDPVAFTRLTKPLPACRVGLVTTASRDESLTDGRTYAADLEDAGRVSAAHLFWHKSATHLDDTETFLPIGALRRLAAEGRIGSVSPRFYGVPTDYSHRRTRTIDAPALLDACRADGVDVMILVPI